MSIFPLPVLAEEEEEKALAQLRPPESIVVRYGHMKSIGEFRYEGSEIPGCGTKLVVRTPRGVELGEMLTTSCGNAGCHKSITRQQMLDYIDQSGGKQFPFTGEGKILRVAGVDDLNEQARLDAQKPEHIQAAKVAIRELDLTMRLVDAEALLGGDRIIFYFTAERRVDFRELVRRLAGELHTRIELRQVGARDEARLVADYEKCGQYCCCKQFLKVLKPISMRLAKIQRATLDPAKISGRCGRLMCCLRYEEVAYDDLRRRLPPRNSRVETTDGPGTVIETQIITQLVLVELEHDGNRAAYPVEELTRLTGDAAAAKQPPAQTDAPSDKTSSQKPDPTPPTDAPAEATNETQPVERRDDADEQHNDQPPSETTPESQPQSSDNNQSDASEQPSRRRRRRGGRRRRRNNRPGE